MSFSAVAPANHTTAPQARGLSVLPAVDASLGAVTFQTPRGHRKYWSPEPEQLLSALACAVRPARWLPEIGTLVVTVAQTGVPAGRGIGFRLLPY